MRAFEDQHKNQTVYLLYTFNNNEENKQKADTRLAKIKHHEKIHLFTFTYLKKITWINELLRACDIEKKPSHAIQTRLLTAVHRLPLSWLAG